MIETFNTKQVMSAENSAGEGTLQIIALNEY
jgi:hypothetical protein